MLNCADHTDAEKTKLDYHFHTWLQTNFRGRGGITALQGQKPLPTLHGDQFDSNELSVCMY